MISNHPSSKTDRKCPQCGSTNVARSQRVDIEERLLSMFNIYPYRCQHHTCKHRFQAPGRR